MQTEITHPGRSNFLYDTSADYDVTVRDVEYRREGNTPLLARIYEPQGPGPFPMLIDIHGGGWHQFDRTRDEPIDTELASHGLLVASLDFRTGKQAPYPADQADINYGIRYFKAHAAEFNARNDVVGMIGFSSGAHQVVLAGLRPSFARYSSIPLEAAPLEGFPTVDASVDFVISGSPPINLARHYIFKKVHEDDYMRLHHFGDHAGIKEASPFHVITGAEEHSLPAILILHGWADKTCMPESVLEFANAYAFEGGSIEVGLFPNTPHIFLNPGLVAESESTERGLAMIKTFIARQTQHKLHPFNSSTGAP